MKISGFTIIRNAVANDYPIVEAITSILPIVDEMIVLVGDSSDGTRDLILSIGNDKIKLFDSIWDTSIRSGGTVLAIETNKAFNLVDPASDWAFYIQADEVVHEKYHPAILAACQAYKDDQRIQGLLFNYLHFYGTYDYVGDSRKWYSHEVRIIRNDKKITAYRDAQGFRVGNAKLWVKPIDAFIYHYGWVKSPLQMKKKQDNVAVFWNKEEAMNEIIGAGDLFDFNDYDSVAKFSGTHPLVMQNRIARQNWNIKLDPTRKKLSFKKRILQWWEKKTGIRLFDFKNYRIVRK